METVLVVVALLVCPLMMLAMGGMAWAAARSRRERSQGAGDTELDAKPVSADRPPASNVEGR
jgi:hypothetical protein